MEYSELARSIGKWLSETYRAFHRTPELDRHLPQTKARIEAVAAEIGVPLRECAGGLVAFLPGGGGAGIVLRADMDALPVTEATGLPWSSQIPGQMHACGHDAHVTMALGALKLLKGRKLPGPLTVCFQPAEETTGGAKPMIDAGAAGRAGMAFALHVAPWLDVGIVGAASGAVLASSDTFSVTISGRGGHGASPHLAVDPVVAACRAVDALQTVVSRTSRPSDGVVVTVGSFHAGSAGNVIPEDARFDGIIRTLSRDGRVRAKEAVRQVAEYTANSCGASAAVSFVESYPAVINDPRAVQLVQAVARRCGVQSVTPPEPSMTCDDFAYFCQALPSCYAHLGCRHPGETDAAGLHSSRFRLDESCLPLGTALLCELAAAGAPCE